MHITRLLFFALAFNLLVERQAAPSTGQPVEELGNAGTKSLAGDATALKSEAFDIVAEKIAAPGAENGTDAKEQTLSSDGVQEELGTKVKSRGTASPTDAPAAAAAAATAAAVSESTPGSKQLDATVPVAAAAAEENKESTTSPAGLVMEQQPGNAVASGRSKEEAQPGSGDTSNIATDNAASTTTSTAVADELVSGATESTSTITSEESAAAAAMDEHDDEDNEPVSKKKTFNFASHDAGAIVLDKAGSAKGFGNLLDDDKDKYVFCSTMFPFFSCL
jgi:hypothetical protein